MPNPLEEWYLQLPPFTRIYTTGIVGLTLALKLQLVTPYQLFYTYQTAFIQGEYWRILTSFLFLGELSFDWILNIYFIVHYCRELEEGSYLNRPADFVWMVLLLCAALLAISPYLGTVFLGDVLVTALTYMWSRHYSFMFINFMGLFMVPAAYLSWIMIAFSSVVENRWPIPEVMVILVSHIVWFLSEEWPRRAESGGKRLICAPRFLCKLLHQDLEEDIEAEQDHQPEPTTAGEHAGEHTPSSDMPLPENDEKREYVEATVDGTSHEIKANELDIQSHASSSAIEQVDISQTLHQRVPHSQS
ncbi:hypothetical protein IWW36_004185 [Coemansia brasiliensis]|uniref:Derlin n=1 Tax=Coemansia brasiliensis TaxID=2650707 RepID=A0A9W8I424_9FUNG|nr:hypothetical protein IWW36_004185 [Coemansia brasiliensis]